MKTINVRDLQKRVRRCIELAQKEQVVVTRHGVPVALVSGVEGYDWEDLYWAIHASFWKMIQRRRGQEGIPLEEVARKLKIPTPDSPAKRLGPRPSRPRRRPASARRTTRTTGAVS